MSTLQILSGQSPSYDASSDTMACLSFARLIADNKLVLCPAVPARLLTSGCGEMILHSSLENRCLNSWNTSPGTCVTKCVIQAGEFQCYDRRALASLAEAAAAVEQPEWGKEGPHDAGEYNSWPEVCLPDAAHAYAAALLRLYLGAACAALLVLPVNVATLFDDQLLLMLLLLLLVLPWLMLLVGCKQPPLH